MSNIYLILPGQTSSLLNKMIKATIGDYSTIIIKDEDNLPDLRNRKILFAVEIDSLGFNIDLFKVLTKLRDRGHNSLEGSTGAILIRGGNELFTKTVAQNILFIANQMGCRFPGRPIVEATGTLSNFLTLQKIYKKPLDEVCLICCDELGKRFRNDNPVLINNPKILVLHSSNRYTSNTLMLWDMIRKHMKGVVTKEIHIENGTVRDCIGCPYKTCKHYGEQNSCFYGGIMVEEVYPAVVDADAIIWICPNYNDSISANMSAVINRLTALFRKTKFYDKSIFGVIVSGSSGSDAIAKQLISALNINKTFRLPPYFTIMATANDKDAIKSVPNIEELAKDFAENLLREIKG